jgi:hypothetical protein
MNFEAPKIINEEANEKEFDKIYKSVCCVSEQVRDNRIKLNIIEDELQKLKAISRIDEKTYEIINILKSAKQTVVIIIIAIVINEIIKRIF